MNSIILRAVYRSRGGLILPLRSTFALHKTQYQTIVTPKPVRQLIILGQTHRTRNFTTTPPLSKKKGGSKGPKPVKAPSKKDNKGLQNGAAAYRRGGAKDFTADWNKGESPDASMWCRRMDMITARTMTRDYGQLEKAVYEWTGLLEEGIQAGVPATYIDATVRRNRHSSPGLREWVTDPTDDVGLWPSGFPLEESDEVDIEKRRREWDAISTSREEEVEEEVEEEGEDSLDEKEYEKFRRETIGPKYDTMTEEERDKAMEDIMWEELGMGRQVVGPEWDTMSKEERVAAFQKLEDSSGRAMFGPEWDTMSEEEKDKMMFQYMGLEEGTENDGDSTEPNSYEEEDDDYDELDEFDPEAEEVDLEDDEDLEAELGGERDDWESEEFENSKKEELERSGEKSELDEVEKRPQRQKS
ncbi:hypothetical protein P167DRAFT_532723 [Morchella conica CCBAS932]|uniref:Uncharacterized protein n=1 Tax=Morchella conica CCBAS932 TaxID=1392247 RepID=A0A3N4KYX3_9PEZI|nr:hypothetical protein P167DRAFT_532723 [Morchella conica CCBAS932]